jgi:hypothetical protein
MPAKPVRLLCVGRERYLLETRCAVLGQSGYDARSATLLEAAELLQTEKYDLVIVSALLSEEERSRILTAVGDSSSTLILNGVTFASELLSEVERKLASVGGEPMGQSI